MVGQNTFPQGKQNTIEAVKEYIKSQIDAGFSIGGATNVWRPWESFQQGMTGAGSVMLPTVTVEGLGNYSKVNGFPTRGGSISWDEYKLRYDRGGSYNIDRVDIFQVAIEGVVDKWAGELTRKQLIPERDKINIMAAFQRLSTALPANVLSLAPTAGNVISQTAQILDSLFDVTGIDSGYNILVNGKFKNLFTASTEVQKTRDVTGPVAAIETRVGAVSGSALQWVPSARMKTAFTIQDGITAGQEAGGVVDASGAQDIVAIISAPDTIQSIDAVDVTNVFGPEVNQTADGTRINMRFFYDTLITKASLPGVYAWVAPAAGG